MGLCTSQLRTCLILLGLGALISCTPTVPKEAFQLQPDSLARRQLQTRQFETKDEKQLLQAGAAVLQDLGFNIDEAETRLGVVVGSKTRDASDTGEIIGKILLGALLSTNISVDKVQSIRAALVSRPSQGIKTSLRVSFQRTVWNDRNEISRTESLEDPILYQEFFDKLSKAVFLEAQGI